MLRCVQTKYSHLVTTVLIALFSGILVPAVKACTRAVYFGKEGQIVTGRSMDWNEEMQSNLWVFPRGLERDGGLGEQSLKWASKFGSIVTSVYEGATADGMNERGLVANLLYLAESEYSPVDDRRPALFVSSWSQYVLDNFATVIASTIWRTVSDQKNRLYFFESTASPSLIWVKLDDIDFKAGSGVRKLPLAGKADLAGNQTANFAKAEPFKFLAPAK